MKTVEEIFSAMAADFRARTGREPDGDGELAARLYAAAAQVSALHAQADWVGRQCFPQTADGAYLDRHAALRGVERRPAARAEGVIRFYRDGPAAQALPIPLGTVCLTAGLGRFETVEAGAIPAGESYADVGARAAEPGAGGNVPAGAITAMAVAPVGVTRCSNPAPFTGGAEAEGDGALRERVLETYRRLPNGANAAFYEQGALSFPQVAAAKVLPRLRGIGTVDVVVATRAGMPDGVLLEELTDYFQSRREIAVDVAVRAPTARTVDVAIKLAPAAGTVFAEAKAAVEERIRAFFSGARLAGPVLRAELGAAVFAVEGVGNCALARPAEDIPAGEDVLPVLGALTVEEMA